ncbi:Ribosome assembly protein 4 {ECO:0000303/PubMed:16221974} AltName: Full=Notchless protein homolog 1 {ECO:0000250/UniProtKB:Q9VPR4}; AltName: Full=Ribosome biogenesis factor RSA4 {ECO:0000303/PubMed:19737519} [Serendipita indica DSM 11827]|nr:Ribosome assembly protein 4 {ECO:0000303/PubMed:16221974} AltName: Full=Notchless protein homolog 1 {ECO:0000250/UniProtKB:Q9VPR4}; AltName: Full=Ribosome biogenesis factor RSA4 {ECO:0000303/PubMed:19737519} [Serendipita indica DSM 11827]
MSKPEIKHYGFKELYAGKEPVVDVVAIHGLDGHRENTWTDGGILWLSHFLPLSLPRARVLTYGYDADTQHETCVSTQNIHRHAQKLAQSLSMNRKDDPRRPIIFIAHDLGGIILKKALVICHNQTLDSEGVLRDILVSTHGILFFGTPHSGLDGNFLERLKRSAPWRMKTTEVITKDLEAHSSELENIQSLYVEASKKITSVFFCADYANATNEKRPRMNVPYHSATIPGDRNATTIVLSCDHQNLVRFSNSKSENYKAVLYYLDAWCKSAPDSVKDNWNIEDNLRSSAKGNHHPSVDASFIFQLPMVASAPSSVHRTCLQGTRQAVLQTIQNWAEDDTSDKPIFWLCDIAGSGKSTVAMSAAASWHVEGKLGGQFFFSIANSDTSTTEKFCSTMARDLAQHISQLAPHVADAVKRNPSIMRSSLEDQFRTLIIDPLRHRDGRVVLVIDAIDECKSGPQRKELVDTLAKAVRQSKNLKVFITSRPDAVIESVLQPLSIKCKLEDRLHDVKHRDNVDDIEMYVHQSLYTVLPQDQRQRLIEKARGLFIWASTACRMINNETTWETPESIYGSLVSVDQPGEIDEVYKLIFERTDPKYHTIMWSMLALLLAAFEPLTAEDLDNILKHSRLRGNSKVLIRNLRSVLIEDEATKVIQFRHPTLVEYLRRRCLVPDLEDSSGMYIDIANAHGQIASWGLDNLRSRGGGLKFNICEIESSFYRNREIPDLEARISRCIGMNIRYASLHWLFHMEKTDSKWRSKLRNEVEQIIRVPYVLYWMEVLSLIGRLPRAIDGLRAVTRNTVEKETKSRISEVMRFMMAFSVPIQESAPHIYISALPFTPTESHLHIEGLDMYKNTLKVTKGLEKTYRGLPEALRGHTSRVTAIAFSPDGSRIVSGSDDETIRLWDAETGQSLGEPFRGHTNSVTAVAFSPDGSRIVSGSWDNTIRLWNAETGQSLGDPLRGHTNSVTAVAFSPDGSRIVSGSDDKTIRLWNAETGQSLGDPLRGHTNSVTAVAFSPDGSRIVSGSWDNTIRLWNAETGQSLGDPLRGHTNWVTAVAFSPDGSRIVSGSWDKTIRLWNAETGQSLGDPLRGHTDSVTAVAFSPDGSRIVSGSWDNTIRLWNAETGQSLGDPLRGHTNSVRAVAFSPDGSRIVSGSWDKTIRLWNAETGQSLGDPLRGHTDSVTAVAFSPDGSRIVSGSWDNTIRLWNAETGQSLGDPLRGHTNSVRAVAFSPDGSRIVSGSADHTIRLWNAETGQSLGDPLRGHTNWVTAVAFSPDGSRIVSGSDDKTIRLWNAETGQSLGDPLRGHTNWVTAVAFSPDGSRIVSGSGDKTIRLWNAETGQSLGDPLRGHTNSVRAVAFSPDGSRIVSGSGDKTIRLWNAETGQSLGDPLRGHTNSVTAVAFSPDGSRIVSGSGDKTIRLWNAETGQSLGDPLRGHTNSVTAVAFSPDGSRIVSGSDDKTIRLWNAETGQSLGDPLRGHTDWGGAVAFSPDGLEITSVPAGSTITLWNTAFAELSNHNGQLTQSIQDDLISHQNTLALLKVMLSQLRTFTLSDDGWVHLSGKLLFWVPPDNRLSLTSPLLLNLPTSSPPYPTKLDFAHFHCGPSWTKVRGSVNQ